MCWALHIPPASADRLGLRGSPGEGLTWGPATPLLLPRVTRGCPRGGGRANASRASGAPGSFLECGCGPWQPPAVISSYLPVGISVLFAAAQGEFFPSITSSADATVAFNSPSEFQGSAELSKAEDSRAGLLTNRSPRQAGGTLSSRLFVVNS